MLKKTGNVCAAATFIGALSFSIQAHATVTYTYDDLGRVTSVTYDDGKRITYSYDPAGNRTQHVIEQAANTPPTAMPDFLFLVATPGATGDVMVLANDSDADLDPLIVQGVSTPSLGTATVGGGGTYVAYTYNGPYLSGSDNFTYTVSDGRGGTAVGAVSVTLIAF